MGHGHKQKHPSKSKSKSKSKSFVWPTEPQVDFEPLRRLKEVGNQPEKDYFIIAIGYPYEAHQGGFACPGSINAMQAIRRMNMEKKHLFITIPFGQSRPVKNFLNYQGKMPIVFVNTGGKFRHVGGGSDLLDFASTNHTISMRDSGSDADSSSDSEADSSSDSDSDHEFS